ncbi:hypothetical protein BC332_18392 [Capsicum chinense]|nr:hypothetical protein BC332_18392 [Capsicum chinense]
MSALGFMEALKDNTVEGNSVGLKLVPWLSWNEWNSIRHSLFSASPASVAFALQRISTWRSRGGIPIAVDVTTAIIEIQQKDPFFRKDLGGNALQSEEMLSMLYCMAIMRLVNGVVEKTRKKAEISIAEAVNAIGIPRMLVDVRHEGSHRDLPSLKLVRVASTKGGQVVESYYKSLKRVVELRLREIMNIFENQFDFMPGRLTTETIYLVRRLMKQFRERRMDLHVMFINPEKSYVKVPGRFCEDA